MDVSSGKATRNSSNHCCPISGPGGQGAGFNPLTRSKLISSTLSNIHSANRAVAKIKKRTSWKLGFWKNQHEKVFWASLPVHNSPLLGKPFHKAESPCASHGWPVPDMGFIEVFVSPSRVLRYLDILYGSLSDHQGDFGWQNLVYQRIC